MRILSVEEHQERINNLRYARENVIDYLREIKTRDYIPGQVIYHLRDAPAYASLAPSDYDVALLTDLASRGYQWIQLHMDWADTVRRWGGDSYHTIDEEGLHKFVRLCHDLGLKVIPYCSSSYFSIDSPDFREDFSRMDAGWEGPNMKLRACYAGSPSWRKYNTEKTFDMIDRYEFDGLYNDMGYDVFLKQYFDEIERKGVFQGHFSELPYDPEVEDYLGMLYYEIKRRGLYYKVHIGDFLLPPCKDKVYDYLWVGEAGTSIRNILSCKHFDTYLTPAFDRNTSRIEDPELPYALTLPYVQFPLLYRGRPMGMQDTEAVTGIKKYRDLEGKGPGKARRWHLAHPDGPHVYSEWSSIPDDPTELDRSSKYLELYRPMVSEDSVIKVEIRKAKFLPELIPDQVLISMFTNEKQYLLISNTQESAYTLRLNEPWMDRQSGHVASEFTIQPSGLLFLVKP